MTVKEFRSALDRFDDNLVICRRNTLRDIDFQISCVSLVVSHGDYLNIDENSNVSHVSDADFVLLY